MPGGEHEVQCGPTTKGPRGGREKDKHPTPQYESESSLDTMTSFYLTNRVSALSEAQLIRKTKDAPTGFPTGVGDDA